MIRKNRLALFLIVSTLLTACSTQAIPQPVPLETQPVETPFQESAPPTEIVPTTETPPISTLWVGFRDDRFGIGLAFPCWWVFTPMPAEGNGSSMSLRSFDEAYFRTHSTKGNWNGNIPPEGVFALDISVFEMIDPTLSTTDAWTSLNDPSMSVIAVAEEKTIGPNQATVVQMKNVDNGSGELFTLYLFRLSPDKILMVSPLFQDRIDANDIQAILNSLALKPDQPITVPTVAPHPPLIPADCTKN